MTEPAPTLDVSRLPPIAYDHRSPSWWGNVLFMAIETTSVAILLVSYYYTKQNFPQWPPPHSDTPDRPQDVLPGLAFGTANAVLLLGSCLVMARTDRAARRGEARGVKAGLAVLTALGVIGVVLRAYEFPALKFRWDDNAYASLAWALVFVHLTYLAIATLEAGITGLWVVAYGLTRNLADDVTLTTFYWYWMVGLWVPVYATVYWAPRIL